MDSHVGHQLTVLQRYWKALAPVYMISQNIFRQILRQHNKQYKYTDKISKTAHRAVFVCLYGVSVIKLLERQKDYKWNSL